MIEEIEQRLVGPVEVLHHQHRRRLLGERLTEAPPGRERLLAAVTAKLPAGEPDQRAEMARNPGRLSLVADEVGHHAGEFAGGVVGRVGFQDAGLGLHDLSQSPQRHAFPVGQAPPLPPDHRLRLRGDLPPQLEDQPALADPRVPYQGHELRILLGLGPCQGIPQQRQLPLAGHQRAPRRLRDVYPQASAGTGRAPDGQRLRLALDADRVERLVVEQLPGRPPGRLSDDHPADRGDALQPGRGVGHVPGEEVLTPLRVGVEGDDRLASVDGHPDGQVQPRAGLVQPVDGLDDVKRRPHGPLGVVLVGCRDAEHADNRIPNELLHRAAETLDLPSGPVVIGAQPGLDLLGIGLVGLGGETHQVADEHADDLALLPPAPGHGQRGSAGEAIPSPPGVLLAAPLADWHAEDRREGSTPCPCMVNPRARRHPPGDQGSETILRG
jgi:hypothetical protein